MQTKHHKLALFGGKELLKIQKQALKSSAQVKVILGGYASGKTTAGALCLLKRALETPWNSDYEQDHPTSLIIGKTQTVLRDSSYRAVKGLIPAFLIRKELRSPSEQRIILENGHQILFRSWSGSIEGLNVAGSVWIDEAQLLDPELFANMVARARDPRSHSVPEIILTGIPLRGWLMEYFGPGKHYPKSEVLHASVYDNIYLASETLERVKASCTAEDAETYMLGQWHQPSDTLVYAYNPAVHLIGEYGDKHKPVHIGIDPGEKTGLVIVQQFRKDEWLVVDEYVASRQTVEKTLRDVLAKGWQLQPGWSTIYLDPTSGRDQLNAIERAVPDGVRVMKRGKGNDVLRQVEYGLRCLNTAFKDANGKTKLWLSNNLSDDSRGLKRSLLLCRRNQYGHIVKDNEHDHSLDALRYVVTDVLPLREESVSVISSRPYDI